MEVESIKIDGVVVSVHSERGKEHMRWNTPYKYQPYPKRLYKAQLRPDGIVSLGEVDDAIFPLDPATGYPRPGSAEIFTEKCGRTVADEREHAKALEEGWRPIGEAMAFHEEKQRAIAQAAAERAHKDARMSQLAQREAAAADTGGETGIEHMAEVPEAQVQKHKGWPKGKKRAPKAVPVEG